MRLFGALGRIKLSYLVFTFRIIKKTSREKSKHRHLKMYFGSAATCRKLTPTHSPAYTLFCNLFTFFFSYITCFFDFQSLFQGYKVLVEAYDICSSLWEHMYYFPSMKQKFNTYLWYLLSWMLIMGVEEQSSVGSHVTCYSGKKYM